LEKLTTIFNFTKLFHEAYQLDLPLDNFPIMLQELITIDITELVKSNKVKSSTKTDLWKEEAYRNFDRIGKIGIEPSNVLNLDIEPSELWDSSFMRVLRTFNERNFHVANCLHDKKSFEDNDNLIKSQIKLMSFIDLPLLLPALKGQRSSSALMEESREKAEPKPSIIIQEQYLERFIKSLSNFTLENSRDNLSKLLKGENITEGIKFSCPANSVIKFFRERHNEHIIASSKTDIAKYIHTFFLFRNNKTKEFCYSKPENIKNYLTRTTPPSGALTTIPFVES